MFCLCNNDTHTIPHLSRRTLLAIKAAAAHCLETLDAHECYKRNFNDLCSTIECDILPLFFYFV